MAKAEIEALITAGVRLSNLAFNIAQETLPVRLADPARAGYKEWDDALRAYRLTLKKRPTRKASK